MSYVYVCVEPPPSKQRFVVKRLRPEFNREPRAPQRFLSECLIWLRLGRHTNIVTARSAHQALPEPPAIVLEYLPGSVRGAMTGTPWEAGRVVLLGIGVLRALLHAGSVLPGFVHADLKPENLLLTSDGVVKVTDFGLSRMAAEHGGPAGGGTPMYMAPEQANGEPLTDAVDRYALGCILFEAITGHPVFGWLTDPDECRRLHADTPPSPTVTGLPDLDRLIAALLAKDPATRPTLRAALDTMAGIADRLGVPVPEASAEPPTWIQLGNVAQSLVNIRLMDEAIALYREILAVPDELDVRYATVGPVLARALREVDRLDEAEAALDRTARAFEHPEARRAAPDLRANWLNERASMAEVRGDRETARRLREQVVHIVPGGSVGWANLGKFRKDEGDSAGAVAAMTRAWQISADLRYAFHLVTWLIVADRATEAVPVGREVVRWHPDSGLAHALCLMALRLGAPADPATRRELAYHVERLGRIGLSVDELEGSGVPPEQWRQWIGGLRRSLAGMGR